MSEWIEICKFEDILPDTGVCALVDHEHVAIFRPTEEGPLYAVSNIDPFAQASVLSRGIIGESQGEFYIASPLKKQRFRLKDGVCLEDNAYVLRTFEVRVRNHIVEVKRSAKMVA